LATAHAENCVTHARLAELTKEHASDLTHILHELVTKGFLQREGQSTGTFYFLPGAHPIENSGAREVFGLDVVGSHSGASTPSSGHKELNSGHKTADSGHNEVLAQHIATLRQTAEPVAKSQRAKPELVVATILKLCDGRYLSLTELSDLLQRDPDTLRKNIIRPMLRDGQLVAEHPNIKNHPKQRYIAAGAANATE
jgi:ATP-dependent DNA helicase RecG